MNKLNATVLGFSLPNFINTTSNPFDSKQTLQSNRMFVVVSLIFAFISSACLFMYIFSKSKKVSEIKLKKPKSPNFQELDQLNHVAELILPPLVELKSVQDLQSEFDDEEGNQLSEIHDGVSDEEYRYQSSDSDEEDNSFPPSFSAKEGHYIYEKKVSLRTKKCLEKLELKLESLEKYCGVAVDNGDCFWDAFAQGLSRLLKQKVTIKELREKVSEEIKQLDVGLEENNWIKKSMLGDHMDTYEHYRDRVAYTCDEILDKHLSFYPVWGKERRDGILLCRHYGVNLKVYSVGCLDDHPSQMENEENFFFGEDLLPLDLPFSHSVEIALYPGHFVPVFDKTVR